MASTNPTQIVKDITQKKISITRSFDAEPELVWQAWTQAELLDQWWAPKPWKAETKSMEFKNGGHWLYAMIGPDATKRWVRMDFQNIQAPRSYEATDVLCDETGMPEPEPLTKEWKNVFAAEGKGTKVVVELKFASETDIQKLMDMGFEGGFADAMANLEQYLKARIKLRNDLKISSGARVCTYLNFPGNTEEAFTFYKSVFGKEFSGKGLQRFGDIPAEPGNPPVADEIKKMILHVELPILGGHVLMATDAPKEMGMTVTQGNNMHISLEPETKAETKRLFDALSAGGNITMPLADMFFGAYFGAFTDKFGINWMFNCIEKK